MNAIRVEYCKGTFITQMTKHDVINSGYSMIEDPDLNYWSIAVKHRNCSVAVSELVSYFLKQIKEFCESDLEEKVLELPMAEFLPKFKNLIRAWGITYYGCTACAELYLVTRSCVPVNITYDFIRKELGNGEKLVCR